MYRLVLCVAVAILLVGCRSAQPLTVADLRAGDALRTTTRIGDRDISVHYRLVRQVNGSLEISAVNSPFPARIALRDISQLEVARGHDRLRGALTGAALGMAGGLIVGMVCRSACDRSDGREHYAPAIGLVVAGAGGTLVGVAIAPAKWHSVHIR